MKYSLIALLIIFLSGCNTSTVKAPCGADGIGCGARIKINQWDN